MSAGFKQVTVNASDVPSTQTNFPAYFDPSRAGTTGIADVNSGRVYADSGKVVEWASEPVGESEVHALVPSLTSTVTLFYDWDGVRSAYATTATYGAEAVWGDLALVNHFETGATDSSGNNTATVSNGRIFSGTTNFAIGEGADLQNNDYCYFTDTGFPTGNQARTLSFWVDNVDVGNSRYLFAAGEYATNKLFAFDMGSVGNLVRIVGYGNDWSTNFVFSTGTKYKIDVGHDGSTLRLYVNGSLQDSETSVTFNTTLDKATVGSWSDGVGGAERLFAKTDLDELRYKQGVNTANWITTEYNNQNDEATFWGTWTDAGGGGFVASPLMHMMAQSGGLM